MAGTTGLEPATSAVTEATHQVFSTTYEESEGLLRFCKSLIIRSRKTYHGLESRVGDFITPSPNPVLPVALSSDKSCAVCPLRGLTAQSIHVPNWSQSHYFDGTPSLLSAEIISNLNPKKSRTSLPGLLTMSTFLPLIQY